MKFFSISFLLCIKWDKGGGGVKGVELFNPVVLPVSLGDLVSPWITHKNAQSFRAPFHPLLISRMASVCRCIVERRHGSGIYTVLPGYSLVPLWSGWSQLLPGLTILLASATKGRSWCNLKFMVCSLSSSGPRNFSWWLNPSTAPSGAVHPTWGLTILSWWLPGQVFGFATPSSRATWTLPGDLQQTFTTPPGTSGNFWVCLCHLETN